jgi:hypothetical protein
MNVLDYLLFNIKIMKPINFKEANAIFGKDQKEYQPLPVLFDMKNPQHGCVSCWQLSEEELEILKTTKCIYLSTLTFGKPLSPQYLTVNKSEVIKVKVIEAPKLQITKPKLIIPHKP